MIKTGKQTGRSSGKRRRYSGRELVASSLWGLRLIWPINPRLTSFRLLLTMLRGALPAAVALAARGIIDTVSVVSQADSPSFAPLVPWVVLAFALALLLTLAELASKLLQAEFADELNLALTERLLVHASMLDLATFEDSNQRDVMHRAERQPAQRLSQLVAELESAATAVLQVVSMIALLATIEPFSLALAPFVIPFIYVQWSQARKRFSEEYGRAKQRRWAGYFAAQLNNTRKLVEVRLLDLAPHFIDRFRNITAGFLRRNRELRWRDFRATSLATVGIVSAVYLLFARVIAEAAAGRISIGDLAVFGAGGMALRAAVDSGTRAIAKWQENASHAADLRTYLELRPQIGATGDTEAGPLRQGIELREVTFSYPGGSGAVLRNLSLEIRPGETLAVVGPNGAGKSTLVKLLARLYDPDEGTILFDGTDLCRISPASLHRQMGVVLQSGELYDATVADNIGYGDWRRLLGTKDEVAAIADRVGLREWIEGMPDGLDTLLGRHFGKYDLSIGQWQKIAVARVLARSEASFLILDEPTASLDAEAEHQFYQRFKELADGRTTLLISHRFSTVSIADRIVVLDQGRIAESGTHDQLIEEEGIYAKLFALHVRQLPEFDALRPRA